MTAVAVAIVSTAIAALAGLTGVKLGVRWTGRTMAQQEDRTHDRERDEAWQGRVDKRLTELSATIGEVKERVAGVEAVLQYAVPELRRSDRPTRRP